MAHDPDLWARLSSVRAPEVWIAIGAGVLYVFRKSGSASKAGKTLEAGVSGMIAFAVAPGLAAWSNINPAVCALLTTSVGYLTLDVFTSIVADRKFIKELIIAKLGGKL